MTTSMKTDKRLNCRTVTDSRIQAKQPKTVRDYLSFFENVLHKYGNIPVFVDRHDSSEDEIVPLANLCVMHEMFSQNPQRCVIIDAKCREAVELGF